MKKLLILLLLFIPLVSFGQTMDTWQYEQSVDEFEAFESLTDVKKYVKKDANKRFPNSGFEW